jgi:phosphatidate cytidylyltransferase
VALASIDIANEDDHPENSISFFVSLMAFTGGVFVTMRKLHWLTGLIVLTIPFRCWMLIQQKQDSFANTVAIFLVVWNADTGALLMGRIASIAHTHIISWDRWPVPLWIHVISPKKSMEGFLGGVLGGVWTAVQWVPGIVKWSSMETSSTFDTLWINSSWQWRMGLGLVLSLLAILGDLVESSIKRQSQAKDSGSVLPGHGGILDRFDSSLLAICFYHVLLEWLASA